jgi:VWFA-related protein
MLIRHRLAVRLTLWPLLLGPVCGAAAQSVPSPGQRPADAPVLRTSAELVRVDVVVVDGNGHAVSGLTAEDFELRQDGEVQTITTLAFVEPTRSLAEMGGRPTSAGAERAVQSAGAPAAPSVFRTIAIVVDDLGLSFTNLHPTQQALRRFIDEDRQPADLVAIVRTGQSQGGLQQFTRDAARLHAAVDAIRWNPFGRGAIDASPPVEKDPVARLRPGEAGPGLTLHGGSPDRARDVYAALGTFGALGAVIDGVGSLPGRKSLVLISEGVQPFDEDSELNPNVEEAMRHVIQRAARSNCAIHTIDPRGLQTLSFNASDNVQGFSIPEFSSAGDTRRRSVRQQQESLFRLAEQTGGLAVVNNNDMRGGLRRALEDQNGYYLLGYTPPKGTFSRATRFHRLKVAVNREGVRVRARPGFFGGRPPTATAGSPLTALFSPIETARIKLRLTPVLGRQGDETVVRLLLHIDADGLAFSESAGVWHAGMEVSGRTVDATGRVVDASNWRYAIDAGSTQLAELRKHGLLYRNQLRIKRPGYYRVMIAVRDVDSGTTGTASHVLDVPDFGGGAFGLSGVLARGESLPDAPCGRNSAGPDAALLSEPAVRVFEAGARLTYALEAYNRPSAALAQHGLPLSVELRVLRDGEELLSRPAAYMTPAHDGVVSVWGAVNLPCTLQPGAYVLEARAAVAGADGSVRVVSQTTDFTVQP